MTQFEIAPHIEKLLFEHDTVTIPELGSFVASPAPASIDYAGGTVAPPSKSLIFNESLTADDGLLVHHVSETLQLDLDDARRLVEEQVSRIKEQLNAREIVALNGIGRLYKNYVQKIQFLPDAVNFSRENYGLPQLQFSPIVRTREVVGNETAETVATQSAPAAPSIPQPQPIAPEAPLTYTPVTDSGINYARIFLILALLGISAALGWYVWSKKMRIKDTPPALETEAPTTEQTTEQTGTVEPAPKEPDPEPATPAVSKTPEPKPEKKPTPPPAATGANNGVLVIGIFKDAVNIARLKKLIASSGFTVYESAGKSGTTIGAQIAYNTAAEMEQQKARLAKATGVQNIWLKKK